MINIKHFFKYFPRKNYSKLIKSWRDILIPGGIIKIQFKLNNNEKKFENLHKSIKQNFFYVRNVDRTDLKINGNITIIAIKKKRMKPTLISVSSKKFNDLLLILKQNKDIISNKNNLCILGYHSNIIKQFLKKINVKVNEIQLFDNLDSLSKISENYFDCAIVANYIEFCNYSTNSETFNILKRILTPNANILVIVPEKKYYSTKNSAQFFDKGIFTRILDENNIKFKWINLSSSFKMIQVFLKNKSRYPINKNNTKVVLLGNYSLRYTFLNNARWDSQARAFENLGYNIKIFDIKENSFSYLLKQIKLFNPDILWIAGKVAYDFLKKYAEFFKSSKIKVVYWLWDIITPIEYNFNGVIDTMFITSKGEIPLYKRTYHLQKVYYMPISIMPEIIHRNKYIKEEYDVGFSGQLSNSNPFYIERTEMFDVARKNFKVKIFKNVYTNLPEHYSKCKIVFGGTPYFKDIELYASNRPYIALAGGCCFITNYFKGLDKLAENEKHLLWFHNKDELKSLLEKYIHNDFLREQIKKNAEKLAKLKHNYEIRITNMLDIVNGKTEEFYGFIN